MKRNILLFIIAATATVFTLSSYITGPAANGQGNRSSAGCGGSTCHGNTNNNNTAVGLVLVDKVTGQAVSNFKYIPSRGYNLYLIANNSSGFTKFGFQLTSIKKLAQTTQAGAFSNWPGSGVVHRTVISGIDIMEHGTTLVGKLSGSSALDTVKMDWTAPATGAGTVRFYYTANCVNGNGSADAADQWNSSFTDLDVDNTAVADTHPSIIGSAFPNPAKDLLNVSLKEAGKYQISVLDITGKVAYTIEAFCNSNSDLIQIPTAGLIPGNYILKVTGSKGMQGIWFAKQ